ncbi:MAG TPA: protein kinase, partial [Polyangiaceae bacterium]|nr:protein kinase [Polyangiaceae bacterium]
DFGIARARHVHEEEGVIKGKFAYMSPEQAQGQKIDRRSDIFALGIVLYELTTGERLFRGENAGHTLKLVTTAKVPDPRESNPKYPEALANILKKALERDVDKRYQTADELRAALERYLVDDRIMVSSASVGQLVRRVLGQRIELQRANLRDALIAADGMLHDGLVPNAPAALRDGPERSTPGADPFLGGPTTLSDPPTGSQGSGSSTPFQQTLDTPAPRRRSALGGMLFAAFGVAAAVSAVVWATSHPNQRALMSSSGGGDHKSAARGVASQAVTESGPEGVSLDSIPLAGQPAGAAAAVAAHPGKKSKEDEKADKKKQDEPPENPYKAKDKQKEEPEAPTPAVVAPPAPEPAPAPAPPPGEAGPFSRGAAMAALGSASSRAAGCKRPDGPTGMSRAMVTFSPAGTVSSVALSAPFAGTSVGNCVSTIFKSARVPAFTGSAITLPQSYRIPE